MRERKGGGEGGREGGRNVPWKVPFAISAIREPVNSSL